MSWFSNIGHAIGKAVTDTGHFVGTAASNPWVKGALAGGLALTGVGAPLAAGIMGGTGLAGGLLRPGGNLGTGLAGGTTGALEGYGAGTVGTALHGAGGLMGVARAIPGIGSMLPGGAGGASADPVAPPTIDLPTYDVNGQAIPGTGGSGSGGIYGNGAGSGGIADASTGGAAGSTPASGGNWYDPLLNAGKRVVGGAVNAATGGSGSGGGSGVADLAMAGLAGASALNAANAAKRAGGLQDQAINLANTNWAAGAPLRTAGTAGLLNPVRPDLSSTYTDASNPFAGRARPLASAGRL